MRLRFFVCGFACGIATLLVSSAVLSGGPPDEKQEQVDMEKLWRKYALPGEPHRKLDVYHGKWYVTMKIWTEGPDKPPTENQAIAITKPIFGGRFNETRLSGVMVYEDEKGEPVEVPFEGLGYTGYDNYKEKYVSVWIDSQGTGIWFSEGSVSDDGSKFTSVGHYDDWMGQIRDKPYMMIDEIVDENTVRMNFHDLSRGPDLKTNRVWQMEWKRKSSR